MLKTKIIAFAICLCNYLLLKVFCFVDIRAAQRNFSLTPTNYKYIRANTTYKLTWIKFIAASLPDNIAERVLFFIALPPQLRLREMANEDIGIEYNVTNGNASLFITRASRLHTGAYSAYKLVYDVANQTTHVEQRKDFYINVTDLQREGGQCLDENDCYCNNCTQNICDCGKQRPVSAVGNCYLAKAIGKTCVHSDQCRYLAGPSAECSPNGMCWCGRNAFAISVPITGRYCVQPKRFGENCTYSEQCKAIGINRHCDHNYRCHCIPGYAYKPGKGCRRSSSPTIAISSLSFLLPTLLVVVTNSRGNR